MTLAWAEWLSFWSNWTLVGALIVGVLATYGIVVSGNVKEAALKLELAEAGKTADAAKADAARANEGASRANERSALLEKEAADARLATEKLKEERGELFRHPRAQS